MKETGDQIKAGEKQRQTICLNVPSASKKIGYIFSQEQKHPAWFGHKLVAGAQLFNESAGINNHTCAKNNL
jgi:hypothetical protein